MKLSLGLAAFALALLLFVGCCGQLGGPQTGINTSGMPSGGSAGTGGTGGAGAVGGTGTGGATGASNASGAGVSTTWCQAGQSWSGGAASGTTPFTILGIEQYKGDSYCHGRMAYSGTGANTYAGQMTYEVYFKQGVNGAVADVWIVVKDANGNVLSETHSVQ